MRRSASRRPETCAAAISGATALTQAPLGAMTLTPDTGSGIVSVAPFAWLVQRFDELIGSSSRMVLYFIHSRRWRENHDATIKAFLARDGTALEVFLPDLENHELMYSLSKHFDDGPQIPSMVTDAYRYFARLAREYGKPAEVWLFGRYPTYSFYQFDTRAVIALYSNASAKKSLPALEIASGSMLGNFLATDIDDLKRECRRRAPEELEAVIANAGDLHP
jgi:hypothetical protein